MKYKEYRNLLLDLLPHLESPALFAAELEKLSEQEKEDLIDVSISEGLQGLLYSALPGQALSFDLRKKLETEYYRITGRLILLKEAFLSIACEFEQKRIDFLVLKGFVYSEYLYALPGQRPMQDVDCLIRKKDASMVDTILRNFGFELTGSDEMNYIRYDTVPIVIDIHTELFFPPAEDLWESSRKIKIANHAYYTPDLESQLVFLISHPLIQHGFLRLIWIYDFLKFLRKYKEELEPLRFQNLTHRYGLEIPFNHFFDFCKKHFLDAYPELNRFSIEKSVSRKTNFFISALFQKSISASKPFEMGYVLYFFLIPGFREKIRFLIKVLFPDEQFLKKRHGKIPGKWGRRLFRPIFMVAKSLGKTAQWIFS